VRGVLWWCERRGVAERGSGGDDVQRGGRGARDTAAPDIKGVALGRERGRGVRRWVPRSGRGRGGPRPNQ
jgi:hypothetical protein